jgi:endonuclease/exonuclease/phosphatase family metal-dependent hydrolase
MWSCLTTIAAAASAIACEPLYETPGSGPAPIFRDRAEPAPAPLSAEPVLRVMAWNIKYGAGRIPFWFDCWGDRVRMSRDEVEANLARVAAIVREVDPDVLLVEEIEVNSRRSAYVDMIDVLLRETSLGYATYFSTWRSRYVPSEGLGRMDLGNAILSKYPITEARAIRQTDRTDQDALTAAFYIHRAIGRAVLDLGDAGQAAVYVVHTEAYDVDGTKQRQIAQIHRVLGEETLPFLIGGDFNELPPVAAHREAFPDERETALCSEDFLQPPYTPEVMQPFYDDFVAAIPLSAYGQTEETQRRYYTHSVLGPDEVNESGVPGFWNRTLDYLFAGNGADFEPGSGDVLQVRGQTVGGLGPPLEGEPLRASDHAPVFGRWRVQP